MSEPVGHAFSQGASTQCLQTSLLKSQRSLPLLSCCSMNCTWRQVVAFSSTVLSYDIPVNDWPSDGSSFHCLHATSHALHPMHTEESVKKPTGRCSGGGSTRSNASKRSRSLMSYPDRVRSSTACAGPDARRRSAP